MKLKVGQCFELQEKLKKELGDDLVYSVALDGDKYVLAISVHKSEKWTFNHGKLIQSCHFTTADLGVKLDKMIETLVDMYKTVLVEKDTENEIS